LPKIIVILARSSLMDVPALPAGQLVPPWLMVADGLNVGADRVRTGSRRSDAADDRREHHGQAG
jgi:hypothetical protein